MRRLASPHQKRAFRTWVCSPAESISSNSRVGYIENMKVLVDELSNEANGGRI